MFERFTQKAIRVIMLAQEESRRVGHNFCGTEMILLGLIGEGAGIATQTLKSLGVNLKDTRDAIEKRIGRGSGYVAVEIPFTPGAKRLLELSWEHARELGHNYICTEHLLLGLLQIPESSAVAVLDQLGIKSSEVRELTLKAIEEAKSNSSAEVPHSEPKPEVSFERHTEKAIKVFMLAQEEARRLGHNYVGTEQILLGLIGEGTGIAAKVLKSLGANLENARVSVENLIGRGSGFKAVEVPFTPRARHLRELSWQAARKLGHNYIGTEHLLLGMVQADESTARSVLEQLGIKAAQVKEKTLRLLGETVNTPSFRATDAKTEATTSDDVLLDQLLIKVWELLRLLKEKAIKSQKFELAAMLRKHETELADDLRKVGFDLQTIGKGDSTNPSDASLLQGFSQQSVKVAVLAQEEARRLVRNFVGTEHLLLGLIGEDDGIAGKVLRSFGVTLKKARVEVEKIIGRGSDFIALEIPYTPRAKRVIELAREAAQKLGRKGIETEHLLLGLTHEKDGGVAARVLEILSVDRKEIEARVHEMLREMK